MGRVTVGRDTNGKLIRKTVYGNTKLEVIKKMTTLQNEVFTGEYVKPDKMTASNWFLYWLKTYKINIKPRTYDSYEAIIKLYLIPNFEKKLLQQITTKDVQEIYNKCLKSEITANTIRKIHNVIKPALKQAIAEGILSKNPADHVQLPSINKKEIKVFTASEQLIFEQISKDYRIHEAFIVNLDTGLRTSEILALTWDCIDFNKKILTVKKNLVNVKDRENDKKILLVQDSTKTNNGVRTIPLTDRCTHLLKILKLKQQKLSNIVFCNVKGGYILPRNYIRTFEKIITKAKLEKCSPHTMRHTFATRLFEAGVPAKTISQLLGHGSVSFTLDTYVSVLPDTKFEAINMLQTQMKSIL